MKSFINTEKIDVLLSELEEYFLLRDKKTHSPNYEIFEEIKNAIASLKGRNSIQIKVYFPIREDDYFSIT